MPLDQDEGVAAHDFRGCPGGLGGFDGTGEKTNMGASRAPTTFVGGLDMHRVPARVLERRKRQVSAHKADNGQRKEKASSHERTKGQKERTRGHKTREHKCGENTTRDGTKRTQRERQQE